MRSQFVVGARARSMHTYKDAKEAFVSDTTGSSLSTVLRVSSITVASFALFLATSRPRSFYLQLTLLVLPILLGLTALSTWSLAITIVLVACASFGRRPVTFEARSLARPVNAAIPPLPSLTTYRANMMLVTVICILAVDFPVFPRWLAKCESWGISMMDLGVGSFVFSQGLVGAIPYVKDPGYAQAPVLGKLIGTGKKCLPILILGLIRVALVKGTDYPEHVSEYGVHWNFFITLGLLPLASILMHPLMETHSISLLGLGITLGHQALLSLTSLQDWGLGNSRDNLVSMNKEGLVSFLGYLAIHTLGFATGTVVLPPSPSHFRRRQSDSPKPISGSRELDKTSTELVAYALIWWSSFAFASLIGDGRMGVSRRLANLSYVLLTVAYNTTFLSGYLLLDMWFSPPPRTKRRYSDAESSGEYSNARLSSQRLAPLDAPELFEALNKNGLLIFLLANVATGLVNLALPTMYMSSGPAMTVLLIYVTAICGVAWLLRGKRLLQL